MIPNLIFLPVFYGTQCAHRAVSSNSKWQAQPQAFWIVLVALVPKSSGLEVPLVTALQTHDILTHFLRGFWILANAPSLYSRTVRLVRCVSGYKWQMATII